MYYLCISSVCNMSGFSPFWQYNSIQRCNKPHHHLTLQCIKPLLMANAHKWLQFRRKSKVIWYVLPSCNSKEWYIYTLILLVFSVLADLQCVIYKYLSLGVCLVYEFSALVIQANVSVLQQQCSVLRCISRACITSVFLVNVLLVYL